MTTLTTLEKIQGIRQHISTYIFEREREVEAMFICLLTGKHAFFLGKPGRAKTEMVNYLAAYIKDARYFYTNCHSFITPNDLVGPLDFIELKQGRQIRSLDNFLANADIVGLDEVFKANKQLSVLLPCLNERRFVQNGKVISTPLMSAFLMSNELPSDKELEALYNRVLFRFEVQGLQVQANRIKLMQKELLPPFTPKPEFMLTKQEILDLQKEVMKIKFPMEVILKADEIIVATNAEGQYVSDRSQGWIVKPTQCYAMFQGRSVVEMEDLAIMSDMLWNTPQDRPAIQRIVNSHCNQELQTILAKVDAVTKIVDEWQRAGEQANHKMSAEQIRVIKQELEAIKPKAKNQQDYDKALSSVVSDHQTVGKAAQKAMMQGGN